MIRPEILLVNSPWRQQVNRNLNLLTFTVFFIFISIVPSFGLESAEVKIHLIKDDIHAKYEERTFYFNYQKNKLTTAKSKKNKKVTDMHPMIFRPILKEILQSPLLKQEIKQYSKTTSCTSETTFEISYQKIFKRVKMCESPNALTKDEKTILNWVNYLINS